MNTESAVLKKSKKLTITFDYKTIIIIILALLLIISITLNSICFFNNSNINNNKIAIASITSPVKTGETVTISIVATPNTYYSGSICYNSDTNYIQPINEKISDSEGYVNLTFDVPTSLSYSADKTFNIIIKGGGETATTSIVIKGSRF